MTIHAWEIVLLAGIFAILLAHSIWLRNVFTRQLRARDATIETLNAAIKLQETHAAALRNDSAQKIVEKYKVMKQQAEEQAGESFRLQQKLKELQIKQAFSEHLASAEKAVAEVGGIFLSQRLLHENLGVLLFPSCQSEGEAPDVSAETVVSMMSHYLVVFKLLSWEVENRKQQTLRSMALAKAG